HLFAEMAAMKFNPSGAGRANEANGEALVVGHGDDGGLAVAGEALDAELLGVHCLVSLEVIEGAAGAPGPGAQCPPIRRFARLALVAQADDAPGEARAVVRLNAVRGDDGVAPALIENLALPAAGAPGPPAAEAEAKLHDHRHRALGVGGRGQR